MNRNRSGDAEMEQDRIDSILAAEEELIPSSGFLSAVMERVTEEARVPAPFPFPWARAIPGFLLALGVFGWGGFELVRLAVPAVRELALTQPHLSTAMELPLEQAGWVVLALAASLASWMLSRRLAGRSGLL